MVALSVVARGRVTLKAKAAGHGRSSPDGGGDGDDDGGGEQVAGASGDDGDVAGSWRMEKAPAKSTQCQYSEYKIINLA